MKIKNITRSILEDNEGLNSFILPACNNGKVDESKVLLEINDDYDKAIIGLIEETPNSEEDKYHVYLATYENVEYIDDPVWKIDSSDNMSFPDIKQAESYLKEEFAVISKDLFGEQELSSPK